MASITNATNQQQLKLSLLLVLAITAFAGCKTRRISTVSEAYIAEGYKLVWADEFNKSGRPDTTSWHYENGFVRNQESQWYQEDNAFIENGVLVIEGRKESKPNPGYKANSREWRSSRENINYTSSS